MARSLKKGPFIDESLMKKIKKLNETNKKQKEEEKEVELLLKKLMENKDLRDKVKEMIGDEQYGEKKE